jgi:hypothetical protein
VVSEKERSRQQHDIPQDGVSRPGWQFYRPCLDSGSRSTCPCLRLEQPKARLGGWHVDDVVDGWRWRVARTSASFRCSGAKVWPNTRGCGPSSLFFTHCYCIVRTSQMEVTPACLFPSQIIISNAGFHANPHMCSGMASLTPASCITLSPTCTCIHTGVLCNTVLLSSCSHPCSTAHSDCMWKQATNLELEFTIHQTAQIAIIHFRSLFVSRS